MKGRMDDCSPLISVSEYQRIIIFPTMHIYMFNKHKRHYVPHSGLAFVECTGPWLVLLSG